MDARLNKKVRQKCRRKGKMSNIEIRESSNKKGR